MLIARQQKGPPEVNDHGFQIAPVGSTILLFLGSVVQMWKWNGKNMERVIIPLRRDNKVEERHRREGYIQGNN